MIFLCAAWSGYIRSMDTNSGRAWALICKELGPQLEHYWIEPGEPGSDDELLHVHCMEYLASLTS